MNANDFNRRIIEEFRANAGVVGGGFAGAPMVLLHTVGARSGAQRVNPLVTLPQGDDLVVFASAGGAPAHPAWFHNLVANPEVTVEVGAETKRMRAHVAEGAERDRLYALQVQRMPAFADYERNTERTIPVVVLSPV